MWLYHISYIYELSVRNNECDITECMIGLENFIQWTQTDATLFANGKKLGAQAHQTFCLDMWERKLGKSDLKKNSSLQFKNQVPRGEKALLTIKNIYSLNHIEYKEVIILLSDFKNQPKEL